MIVPKMRENKYFFAIKIQQFRNITHNTKIKAMKRKTTGSNAQTKIFIRRDEYK